MTPKDTLLYSQLSDLFSHHQRSFLLQEMERDTEHRETEPDILWRERETLESTVLNDISPSILFSHPLQSTGNPRKRRQKKWGRQRGWRRPAEKGPLKQLSKAHISSKRLKQHTQDLGSSALSPPHMYHSFRFSTAGLLNV